MPATVVVNFMTVVHKSSGGVSFSFPDVCKTPTPGGPVPIPYPNIAMLENAKGSSCSKKVRIEKKKVFHQGSVVSRSSGDEAGTLKGVVSQKNMGKAKALRTSIKVKAEGKPVVFQTCTMGQNGTPPNIPAGVLVVCSQSRVKTIG